MSWGPQAVPAPPTSAAAYGDAPTLPRQLTQPEPMRAAYLALVVFLAVFCARPEDWIPGLSLLHLDRIAGGLAVAATGMGVVFGRREALRLPASLKFLVLLLAQLLLAAVFSTVWAGGAVNLVVNQFSKAVMIAVVIFWAASAFERIRTLLFLQAASVTLIGVVTIWKGRLLQGRLDGVLGGMYANPNDLALSLAVVIPLCFAFLLLSKSRLRKLVWGAVIVTMIYAVTLTYSRGGLLCVLTAVGLCVWQFGVRGGRRWLPVTAALAFMVLLAVAGPSGYGQRIATIFNPASDPTGSAQQRLALQYRSVAVTFDHPLLGVGPGNFEVLSGNWHVNHDAFMQMASEGGLPALLLFTLILWRAFVDLRAAAKAEREEVRIFAGALRASLAAFVVGACFASVAYLFMPYVLVGYSCALKRIGRQEDAPPQRLPAAQGLREFPCAG